MIFFPNKTVAIYEYEESTEQYNIYGEPEAEYTLIATVKGDFQPVSPNEAVEMEGTIYSDTFKLYLPLNTQITRTCKVKIDDEFYDIIGSPQVYDHTIIKHIKCTLQKERK